MIDLFFYSRFVSRLLHIIDRENGSQRRVPQGSEFVKGVGLGKGVRINLGKDGISSVSFGRRDAPHVTVGKRGTYVGASIQKRQPLPANLRAERP